MPYLSIIRVLKSPNRSKNAPTGKEEMPNTAIPRVKAKLNVLACLEQSSSYLKLPSFYGQSLLLNFKLNVLENEAARLLPGDSVIQFF